jgi:hypothetical protein
MNFLIWSSLQWREFFFVDFSELEARLLNNIGGEEVLLTRREYL